MQLAAFDEDYLDRLKTGETEIENHFASYFGDLLSRKLRMRLRSKQMIEDIRQETLMRVLQRLRQRRGISHPEKFGAFVNAVCDHVMMEYWRVQARHDRLDGNWEGLRHGNGSLEGSLMDWDLKRQIERVLEEMPLKDRVLLRAIYLDEMDKAEVCRLQGVGSAYLRVRLHRAKVRFRRIYDGQARVISKAA